MVSYRTTRTTKHFPPKPSADKIGRSMQTYTQMPEMAIGHCLCKHRTSNQDAFVEVGIDVGIDVGFDDEDLLPSPHEDLNVDHSLGKPKQSALVVPTPSDLLEKGVVPVCFASVTPETRETRGLHLNAKSKWNINECTFMGEVIQDFSIDPSAEWIMQEFSRILGGSSEKDLESFLSTAEPERQTCKQTELFLGILS